jgi:hypothetical protein
MSTDVLLAASVGGLVGALGGGAIGAAIAAFLRSDWLFQRCIRSDFRAIGRAQRRNRDKAGR